MRTSSLLFLCLWICVFITQASSHLCMGSCEKSFEAICPLFCILWSSTHPQSGSLCPSWCCTRGSFPCDARTLCAGSAAPPEKTFLESWPETWPDKIQTENLPTVRLTDERNLICFKTYFVPQFVQSGVLKCFSQFGIMVFQVVAVQGTVVLLPIHSVLGQDDYESKYS